MSITWEDSGKGLIYEITLADAQHLAIEAGFVFAVDESQPLSKRANLQKLFDRFNVNSLSAFRQKFYTYQLNPHLDKDTSSLSRRDSQIWGTQELINKNTATDTYIGQLLHGQPHGLGILLTQGATYPYGYIGKFENGLQNGYGIIKTLRGESFNGFFKDGETYGPGSYIFPRPGKRKHDQHLASYLTTPEDDDPEEIEKNLKRHRVRFDGMHSGRPFGKGVVVWSDGERESGEFDGMELKRRLSFEECRGVLLVAEQNAEMAKRVATEVEDELKKQGLWEGHAEVLLAKGMMGSL